MQDYLNAGKTLSYFLKQESFKNIHIQMTLLVSDQGCISLLVLLDLSAAFDTIDHDILID